MEGAIVAVPKQRPQPAVVGKFRAVWMSPHCQWLINGNTGEMVTKEEDGFCYTVISDLDDTCNYYYKQRYMVGEDGIPTPVLQDDEADDDQESIKCYKIFEVQKMIREDGSHFMFNLNTRQSVAANINFKELIYKNNESGDVFEFLVYRFQEPPGVSCVRSYVRLQDFQTVINLKMSCAVSAKWLQRNWDGWQREYQAWDDEASENWRSFRSVSRAHTSQSCPAPMNGQNCMETWAGTFLFLLWWLLHVCRNLRKTIHCIKVRVQIRQTFEPLPVA